jgi:hypothetical protein
VQFATSRSGSLDYGNFGDCCGKQRNFGIFFLPFFVVKSPLKRGKKEREGGKRKEGRKDAKPLS